MTTYDAIMIARFWAKVDVRGPDECWPWKASTRRGYGKIRPTKSRKWVSAHVMSFELNKGPLPAGMWALHTCDNRICCNPNHLFAGSAQDNTDDMMRKGRHRTAAQSGGRNGNAKLDPMDVIEIKGLIAGGLNNTQIAARYGVTHSAISLIRRGKKWKVLFSGCEPGLTGSLQELGVGSVTPAVHQFDAGVQGTARPHKPGTDGAVPSPASMAS